MELCISNIAWDGRSDSDLYKKCNQFGFNGIEIAPTRVFPDKPYKHIQEAKDWTKKLYESYGLKVFSIQSIWYGRTENIFGSQSDRAMLLDYTKQAIEFASVVGASNVVFGCPLNRNGLTTGNVERNRSIAKEFFLSIGKSARDYGTCVAIEANPSIYGTDFLNTTRDAIDFIAKLDSSRILLNLDLGTMIHNREKLSVISGNENLINHVHISEPFLEIIKERKEHLILFDYLNRVHYNKAVSIEMGKQDDIETVYRTMEYMKRCFETIGHMKYNNHKL